MKSPFTIEDLGRWLARHDVELGMLCLAGNWRVTMTQKRLLHYYSEDQSAGGETEHTETWQHTSIHRDQLSALALAMAAVEARP